MCSGGCGYGLPLVLGVEDRLSALLRRMLPPVYGCKLAHPCVTHDHAHLDARAPKGVVVLAIGLPGSGKTTWFKRRGVTPLSSDMLRGILFDDITEQRYMGLVFSTLRSLLRARLIARMPWNYVDASNLASHERRQWIKMAKGFGYEVHAVFFNVPLQVSLE